MNLTIEGLSLRAPDFELSLDLTLHGAIVGLFGESGAGKTTLLNLVAGLLTPDRGRIEFDRRPFFDAASAVDVPARLREIGYVPQERALFPHLSVARNVLYATRAARSRHDGAGTFSVEHVTGLLEIGGLMDRNPLTLSGGEQQRVAIARALLSRPKLLLLDEPLSGLDENLKEKALGLIGRIHSEFQVPVIYVSHAAREVARICDEVVVLSRGRLVTQGTSAEVFEETFSPELRVRENFSPRGIRG